jgi:hypothetical protein
MYHASLYRNWAREYRACGRNSLAKATFLKSLREAFKSKAYEDGKISLREVAEETIPDGREFVRAMDPQRGGIMLAEAVDAVDTSAFSNIIGQLVINKVLEGYSDEEFKFTAVAQHINTKFSGERVPGIGGMGDVAEAIGEGKNFPTVGLNEDYIDTPATTKHGMIVPVTKEAIFFDRTNLVMQRAGEVGHFLGLNKEKRIIDCFIDGNTAAYRYKWKGTVYATYQATSPWINVKTTNGLSDWTSVQNAELLLAQMTDPNTGEVITVLPDMLVVPPALLHTAFQIVKATEVRKVANNSAGTANTWTNGPNPLEANPLAQSGYDILSSRVYRQQALKANSGTADTNWYLTNIKKHLAYFENWPITVVQAPQNSEAEFTQDVVVRFKASERGSPATLDPRYTVQSNA